LLLPAISGGDEMTMPMPDRDMLTAAVDVIVTF
jgi:hypothetical protein